MWERVSEEESVKKSECGLSCWLVLPAARKQRERKTRQVCPALKACMEESERMLPRLFIISQRSDPGWMAWNILIGWKYEFGTKTVKIFLCQTIIWNSFCYKFIRGYCIYCKWLFLQWNLSTATPMEDVYEPQEALCWKINFIWSHSIRESWWALELFSRPSYQIDI